MPDVDTLLEHFRQGDRLALSRLLSLVARGDQVPKIAAALLHSPPPKVVAITGSAGVGKSTLIGKLIEHIRSQKQKVAVLACDPQSPLSGGALLGDRFRMPAQFVDDGVFIRSLAALSGHGAVADHLPLMTRLLGKFGFDTVLVETVGAGQGDVTVSELADVVVLLLQPETGDDLQWEKAGVLEVADIIVVQKADLPRAEQVAAQVQAALDLAEKKPIPVLLVSAKTGKGIPELWQKIAEASPKPQHDFNGVDQLIQLALKQLTQQFGDLSRTHKEQMDQLLKRWERGELSPEEATSELMKMILPRY